MGFLSNIIENHDEPRGASTFLPDYAQNDDGVKMLATASLLLRGVPFIYQGQEIGMRNFKARSIEEFDDLNTKDQYELALRMSCTEQEALTCCNRMSRDNARRPMQWNAEDRSLILIYKDAMSATVALCEAAAYYKTKNMTLWDAMVALYEKYGYYKDAVKSIELKGIEGLATVSYTHLS